MHAVRPTRPVTTLRPEPTAPKPEWKGLFREPVYADGKPYNTGDEQDDDGQDAA